MVVAVSGGSDSTALLLLLHDHLQRHGCLSKLLAVTVDHKLRTEAADEARAVAARCARLGICHRTMTWLELKPATGVAAAARAERYRLLLQATEEAGADLLFTGHTADDQAETVAMRAQRGSGIGLAGMAPATLVQRRVWLWRPMLDVTRAELRAFLSHRGEGWIEDPSNTNPASERVRVRSLLDDQSRRRWVSESKGAAARRRELALRAADLIAATIRVQDSAVVVAPDLFGDVNRDAAVHTLRFLLQLIGGNPHLPDEQRTRALLVQLNDRGQSTSLARCVLTHRRDGILIRREQRGSAEPAPAAITLLRESLVQRPVTSAFDLPLIAAFALLAGAPELPPLPFREGDAPIP
ncbi:tRNA lysidine(34) synthetase TilS [Tianweitania sediminis]|uniref:tRNA(Ile)-lysidine synthase n=2 Tax=Tianweitania sediminis TaxID=1502156 RepID=A0A8J7R050_9HYPH|nr:tRNA lysidine(34) synthetase TilS [Tianweitania sediminis]